MWLEVGFFYKFETINPAEWKRYIYFDERGYPKEGIKTLRSINSCEIEHPARKIALSKKHAYLAGDYLNIVDLDSLKEAGYYKLPAKANDIAFSEPYIFVTFKSDTLSGLQVYENLLLGKKIRRPYNV